MSRTAAEKTIGRKFGDAASWCPFCGVRSLLRDRYGESLERPTFKSEYQCSTCGMGFHLSPSVRWQHATRLAKDHRALRPSERTPKVKPPDIELHTLQHFAKRIGVPGDLKRCKKGRFALLDKNGVAHGSVGFKQMMLILRGFQIATLNLPLETT